MTILRNLAALFAFLAAAMASAQAPQDRPPPRRIDVAAALSIDASRAAQVEAILDAGHQRVMALRAQGRPTDEARHAAMHAAMEAIRTETDAQLAAVLTAEELARLHAVMPPPPGAGRRM